MRSLGRQQAAVRSFASAQLCDNAYLNPDLPWSMKCSSKLGIATLSERRMKMSRQSESCFNVTMKFLSLIVLGCLSETLVIASEYKDFLLDQYDDYEIEYVKDMCIRDRRANQDMGLSVFSPTATRVIAEGMVTNGEFLSVESGQEKLMEYKKLKALLCPDVW